MTFLALMAVLLAAETSQTQTGADVQTSHVTANVPAPADFEPFLRRDLGAYLAKALRLKNPQVQVDLLRDLPTQSGVAYPKYYVWVRINGGKSATDRGAARVAAVERKGFEILKFLSEEEMRANPGTLKLVFPAEVCERIEAKLAATR